MLTWSIFQNEETWLVPWRGRQMYWFSKMLRRSAVCTARWWCGGYFYLLMTELLWRHMLLLISLQWPHSECDGVSNHQPCDCLLGDRWIPRTNNNNNGPNGNLFYVGGDLMMRRGMQPIIMLPDRDLRIALHLVPFWILTIWGSVHIARCIVFNQRRHLFVQSPQLYLLIFVWRN